MRATLLRKMGVLPGSHSKGSLADSLFWRKLLSTPRETETSLHRRARLMKKKKCFLGSGSAWGALKVRRLRLTPAVGFFVRSARVGCYYHGEPLSESCVKSMRRTRMISRMLRWRVVSV